MRGGEIAEHGMENKKGKTGELTLHHSRGIKVPTAAQPLGSPGWYSSVEDLWPRIVIRHGDNLTAILAPYVERIDKFLDAKQCTSGEEVVEREIAVQESRKQLNERQRVRVRTRRTRTVQFQRLLMITVSKRRRQVRLRGRIETDHSNLKHSRCKGRASVERLHTVFLPCCS